MDAEGAAPDVGAAIRENLARVRSRLAEAAARSGRRAEDVQLVAVSKTMPVEVIEQAIAAGLTVFGENRPQELRDKFRILGKTVRWHFIGHLQRNKVKYLVDSVELIHSLDSLPLAEDLSAAAERAGRRFDVLVQVNVASEATKFGLAPEGLPAFLESLGRLGGLRVRGLMTIAPLTADPEAARPHFVRLRELAAEAGRLGFPWVTMEFLSMGMSGDFEVAVEEGANIVRLGTAIFGPRTPKL